MNATPLHVFIDTQLTPARFGAWLGKRARRTVVGLRRTSGACPLACYLFAVSEGQEFLVSDHISIEGEELPPPAWAVEFMARVDTGRHSRITAALALRVLGRVTGGST